MSQSIQYILAPQGETSEVSMSEAASLPTSGQGGVYSRSGSPWMHPHDGRIGRRSTTPRPPTSETAKLAKRIGQVMAMMDYKVAKTMDAQHVALKGLSADAQAEALKLQEAPARITRGEAIVETELQTMRRSYERLYAAVVAEKTTFQAKVAEELEAQQARQRHQAEVSTHLHRSIGESSQASLTRDQQLEAELVSLKRTRDRDHQEYLAMMGRMEEVHSAREQTQEENLRQLRHESRVEAEEVRRQMADLLALGNKMTQILETANKPPPQEPEAVYHGEYKEDGIEITVVKTSPHDSSKGKGPERPNPAPTGTPRWPFMSGALQGNGGGNLPPLPPRPGMAPGDPDSGDSSSDDEGDDRRKDKGRKEGRRRKDSSDEDESGEVVSA